MESSTRSFVLTEEFLRKYDVPGPRYTSYPPAPHFREGYSQQELTAIFVDSNQQGPKELSFYIHVPFCPKQCLFCGCTTEIGKPGSLVVAYFAALEREMERVLPLLDATRPVTQIHFGGGTPNGVPYRFLAEIVERLRMRFVFADWAEIAIECDPNLLTYSKLAQLREIGFNRVSFGLQDFNREVLAQVNRDFPRIAPHDLIAEAHRLGFLGVNLDLIYGLPQQTPEGFAKTVQQTLDASPDRVATFSYAHVPWAKDHQKVLETRGLPTADAKLAMTVQTYAAFVEAGYVPIGMDHFAKPTDELAIASGNFQLHRNFQGYCSKRTTGQVVGFGASAISQMHTGYVQNTKEAGNYIAQVDQGLLPVERAWVMSQEDRFRRNVINSLMCDNRLDLDSVGASEGYTPAQTRLELQSGLDSLQDFIADGLAVFNGDVVSVTQQGRLAVRNIAMRFDPLLGQGNGKYSRTV